MITPLEKLDSTNHPIWNGWSGLKARSTGDAERSEASPKIATVSSDTTRIYNDELENAAANVPPVMTHACNRKNLNLKTYLLLNENKTTAHVQNRYTVIRLQHENPACGFAKRCDMSHYTKASRICQLVHSFLRGSVDTYTKDCAGFGQKKAAL